jgi:hypothetical protein
MSGPSSALTVASSVRLVLLLDSFQLSRVAHILLFLRFLAEPLGSMPDSPSKRPETEALHADDPIAHKSPAVSPDIRCVKFRCYPIELSVMSA